MHLHWLSSQLQELRHPSLQLLLLPCLHSTRSSSLPLLALGVELLPQPQPQQPRQPHSRQLDGLPLMQQHMGGRSTLVERVTCRIHPLCLQACLQRPHHPQPRSQLQLPPGQHPQQRQQRQW